jgi:hypothetical protein
MSTVNGRSFNLNLVSRQHPPMENTLFPVLSVTALVLLIVVTGGIVYLTLADWRDRRRQEQEKRGEKKNEKRKK